MDELNKTIEALRAEIAELRAGESSLDVARRITAARTELNTATAELAEFTAAEAALAELDAEDEAAKAADEDPKPDPVVPAPDPTPATPAEPEEPATPAADRVLVTASASDPEVDVSPTATQTEPTFTLTASGNIGGVAAGAILDRERMLRMLQGTLTASGSEVNRSRMFEMNTHKAGSEVASMRRGAFENSMILKAAGETNAQSLALTAAACFCGPDRVETEVGVVGCEARPVAALFPSVPVDGGFRYVPDICTPTNAVAKWTCADQDLVDSNDPATWKQCPELDCFTERVVTPYMVVACTTVNRTQQFAHPEQVDAWLEAIRIEYARKAEVRLLDELEADAGAVLTVGAAGGTMAAHGLLAKFIYMLGSVAFALGQEFRCEGLEGRTIIIPKGLIEAFLSDENIRGFNHNKLKTELLNEFRVNYGITIVERLDESTSRQAIADASVAALNAGGAIDSSPTVIAPPSWRIYIVDPTQYRRGEGQLVGADWHVDTAMLRQNKLLYFWENLEFLELMGCIQPRIVDITGCINGARSDLTSAPAC